MSFLSTVQQALTRYGMSTYLVLGNIGNLANIAIFCRKQHRKNSCSLYLLTASFINIFVINYGIIPTLYSLDYPNPELYIVAFCKLRLYFLHSSLMMSRSLIVLACIDRFALSSSSLRVRSFCRTKIAFSAIVCIFIVWPIIAVHIPILLTIQSGRCGMTNPYSLIYSIYSFIIAGLLPPALMVIFGIKTIRNLHLIHARIQPNADENFRIKRKDYNLMVMLMWEVVVYLVSTTPYPIQTLYLAVTSNIIKTTLRLQIESFITFMAYSFLIYINSASPFYVYFSTSRTFRQECKQLFIRMRGQALTTTRGNPINRATHSIPQQRQRTSHL